MKYIIVLALLAAVALPAAAEQGPSRPQPPRPDMAAMQQREEDDFGLVLGLSSAQRPALDAFVVAQRPPMHRPDDRPPTMSPGGPPSFEQELAHREAADAERARGEQARLGAERAFYAQLDPRQRQVFEALMRLRHGPGGPDGPGRPHQGPGMDGHGPTDGPDGHDGPPPAMPRG